MCEIEEMALAKVADGAEWQPCLVSLPLGFCGCSSCFSHTRDKKNDYNVALGEACQLRLLKHYTSQVQGFIVISRKERAKQNSKTSAHLEILEVLGSLGTKLV